MCHPTLTPRSRPGYNSGTLKPTRAAIHTMCSKLIHAVAATAVLLAAGAASAATPASSAKNLFCPVKGKISIVEFEASWCTPCKLMKPSWKKVEKDYRGKLSFVHIDIDEEKEIAQAFQVSAVPTQVLFDRKCQILDVHSGYLSEADLRATFDQVVKHY